jgi:hypothetical protein
LGNLTKIPQYNLYKITFYEGTNNEYYTYVIRVDLDKHKIKPVENPKFLDAQGKPLKRYELIIVHVNNQKEQIWTVSKTVCLQILEQLRKGFRTFKVIRTGADRSTTYQIEGV